MSETVNWTMACMFMDKLSVGSRLVVLEHGLCGICPEGEAIVGAKDKARLLAEIADLRAAG